MISELGGKSKVDETARRLIVVGEWIEEACNLVEMPAQ